MEILKDAQPSTTVTAGSIIVPKETNPRYVVEAVAIVLGLKPSMCRYVWPHYVAMVRNSPLVPCIRCGAASDAEMVVDVEGPMFLINRTRTVNKEVSMAFKSAKAFVGSATHTRESELMIFNGFCESCLSEVEDQLPPIFRAFVPEDPDITVVRDLVAKALRQGRAYEIAKSLRRVVDRGPRSMPQ